MRLLCVFFCFFGNGIALRRKTHTAHKAPVQLRSTIPKVHSGTDRKRGKYEDYDKHGSGHCFLLFSTTVSAMMKLRQWNLVHERSSDFDEHQGTAGLTIFPNGVSRLLRKSISTNEKRSWDSLVNVMLQRKASE